MQYHCLETLHLEWIINGIRFSFCILAFLKLTESKMKDSKSSKTRLRAASYYSSSFASLSLWEPKEMVNLGRFFPDQPHSSSYTNSFHQSPLPNRQWLSLIKKPRAGEHIALALEMNLCKLCGHMLLQYVYFNQCCLTGWKAQPLSENTIQT